MQHHDLTAGQTPRLGVRRADSTSSLSTEFLYTASAAPDNLSAVGRDVTVIANAFVEVCPLFLGDVVAKRQ